MRTTINEEDFLQIRESEMESFINLWNSHKDGAITEDELIASVIKLQDDSEVKNFALYEDEFTEMEYEEDMVHELVSSSIHEALQEDNSYMRGIGSGSILYTLYPDVMDNCEVSGLIETIVW